MKPVDELIKLGLPDAQVIVAGEGCSVEVVVISDECEGKMPLARQRLVMATVKEEIASGELHAIALKTWTPEQWKAQQ